MQFDIEILADGRIIYITGFGKANIRKVIESIGTMAYYATDESDWSIVVDFRQVTELFSINEIRWVANALYKLREYFKGIRTAIIVNVSEMDKASFICTMVLPYGIHMEAYSDRESAMRYISVV